MDATARQEIAASQAPRETRAISARVATADKPAWFPDWTDQACAIIATGQTAFAVAKYTIRQFDKYTPIFGVVLDDLRRKGLYTRETRQKINGDGRPELIDVPSISADYDGRISTEHANARFFVLCFERTGWALVVDSDVMFLDNPDKLFALADPTKALMVVHHDYRPAETVKMDGQRQTRYARKNQSSVMLINCEHKAHRKLTLHGLNTLPGRDLHRFYWLDDEEIGELPPEWNYLVGVSKLPNGVRPKLVHFTRGLPEMAGWENQEYAEQWRSLRPYAVGALVENDTMVGRRKSALATT